MAIGNIIKDISGIKDFLTNVFGNSSGWSKKYPEKLGPNVSTKQITNYIEKYNDRNWQSSRGYSFNVVRVEEGAEKIDTQWQEFRLQINPQELTQDEVFAIEVTPTLRGVLVEHHGTILKDITMSGTTGQTPNAREGGSTADAGLPILQSGHSGYEEFQELRSYFRAYVEQKRLDQKIGGELRMVLYNYKDNEYLYVEPQKFTMKRSSGRPFLYDYNIQLKAVGVANKPGAKDKKWYESLDETLTNVQDYFNLASQTINGLSGIIRRVESDIANTILQPLQSLNQAVTAIRGGQALLFGEFGITRRFVEQFQKEVERVENNFNDALGRDMDDFNSASGRTPTLVGAAGRPSTDDELTLLNALGAAKKGAVSLLALSDTVFEPNTFEQNSKVLEQSGGVYDIPAPNSTKEVSITGSDDIQTIAARELGDADKFKDIITLNGLKPPYISETGGPNVLKPGDKILLPSQQASIGTGASKGGRQFEITRNMREAEKDLGVDIRLTNNGDLAISNTSDLDLLAGVDNMVQALQVRLALEKGSLKRHLFVGTELQLGQKVRTQGLNVTRDQIISSFSQDSRIESVPIVDLRQEGGTTFINMVVKLKNVDQPVPLPLAVNSG